MVKFQNNNTSLGNPALVAGIMQMVPNIFGNIGWDETAEFEKLLQEAISKNWYVVHGTDLGAGKLDSMTPEELQAFINYLPLHVSAVSTGVPRKDARYRQVLETLKQYALQRLNGGSGNSGGGVGPGGRSTTAGFTMDASTLITGVVFIGVAAGIYAAFRKKNPQSFKKPAA